MSREGVVAFASSPEALHSTYGGELDSGLAAIVALAAVEVARGGDLALCAARRHVQAAREAESRGALILSLPEYRLGRWRHPHAAWVFAALLGSVTVPLAEPEIPDDAVLEPGALILPGVRLGRRVRVGAGSVVGRRGFGYATTPEGMPVAIPHRGGVAIADDVEIGAYCTIDAGVLLPTRIGSGSKLDSHVHVGHNVVLGARVRVAAQVGFAGSVHVGDDVWIGGQAGLADHVHVGAGARIAAKAGVIGDVAAGVTVAGYPAVSRRRWLRGHARLYRGLR